MTGDLTAEWQMRIPDDIAVYRDLSIFGLGTLPNSTRSAPQSARKYGAPFATIIGPAVPRSGDMVRSEKPYSRPLNQESAGFARGCYQVTHDNTQCGTPARLDYRRKARFPIREG